LRSLNWSSFDAITQSFSRVIVLRQIRVQRDRKLQKSFLY